MKLDRRALLAALPLLLAAGNPAEAPHPQSKPRWMVRHQQKIEQLHATRPDVIFVGDSITEELENDRPRLGDIHGVWNAWFGCRHAINLGFAGDTTGNVLWRLRNGEVDGIHPRLAVLLIGTNDVGTVARASPREAAEGVRAVAAALHTRLPGTRILVVGLLPRQRAEAERAGVNRLLAAMDWSALDASYVDVSNALMSNGAPDPSLYRESLTGRPLTHPNGQGWARLAAALEPAIGAALGDHRTVSARGVCPAG